MAEGVYYNQEVTAEMLNGMAADLGHTSFNGFSNDVKFGADELNKITGDLVGAGVLISGNMCRVIKDDSGNIILQTGIIVFANGAKMEITSPVTIDADAGTVIYALNDTLQGKCTIEVAQSYPTEGDFVKLCTVGTNKTLNDDRTIAKAKMDLYTGNSSWSVDVVYPKPASYEYSWVTTEIPRAVWDKYNYVIFIWPYKATNVNETFTKMYTKPLLLNVPGTTADPFIWFWYSYTTYWMEGTIKESENGITLHTTLKLDAGSQNPTWGTGGTVTIMLI